MTEKEKDTITPDQGKDTVQDQTEFEEPTQAQWQDALKEAVRQRDEYFTMVQRGQAEFANYRKRTEAARSEAFDEGIREALSQMLPFIDNLERAIKAAKDHGDEGPLMQGVEMTQRMMLESVKKLGLEEVEAEGQMFDPEKHNAVMRADEGEPGMILEVFQKGYRAKGKIIRYPMVKVAVE